MTNLEISQLLREVSAAYAVKDEQKYKFQIIAYNKAADSIEHATTELKNLFAENRMTGIPGIGPSIAAHLEELLKTGRVKHFDTLLQDLPRAMFPLLLIPSFGPKKAYRLVAHFKLTNPRTVLSDLKKLAVSGEIAKLEGFGEKSQEDILQALGEYKLGVTKSARMVLPYASSLADEVIVYLKKSNDVLKAYPLGSLRRQVSTIGDVDIAVATNQPEKVLEYFTKFPNKERVLEKGEATASILVGSGKHIDLMVQSPERFGSLLQHFTGSKAHNIHLREYALKKGLSLSEYGIKRINKKNKDKKVRESDESEIFDTEEKFYQALGLQWIPPEIREDTGEIELASKNSLPNLIELSDIKGDFHLHSNFPIEPSHDMGQNTFEEMIQKAIKLHYDYLGFSEHNPSVSKHTSSQIYNILLNRSKKIDQLTLNNKNIRIFSLLETDILTHGDLAIDDRALSLLDGTIVSIHSSFSMSKTEMTKRVLKGLSHPKAKILGHPTGRLLNERVGYDLDWDEIFSYVLKNNKALEINSWPLRLDLPDGLTKIAIEKGVKLFINTDSHAAEHMDLMKFGVSVARRGWATKDDIINTWEYNKVKEWFRN